MALIGCGCCNSDFGKIIGIGRSEGVSRRRIFEAAAVTLAAAAAGPLSASAATVDDRNAFASALGMAGPADFILVGGVVTMAPGQPTAEALAVRGGRIVAVGYRKDVMARKGPKTRIIESAGKTILPGFIDPHVHIVSSSALNLYLDLSPFANKDHDAVLAKIAAAAAKAKPGDWVIGQLYDTALMPGRPDLTRADLDRASPKNPVFVISASQHFGYVNSKTLEAAGIAETITDPAGGMFLRDAQGKLNGVLAEMGAMLPVAAKMPTPQATDIVNSIAAMMRMASAAGCTAIHEAAMGALGGVEEWALIKAGAKASGGAVRVAGAVLFEKLEEMKALPGVVQGGGDEQIRVTGVKLVSDGSNQGLTGYLRDPYLGSESRGLANYSQEELNAIAIKLNRDGWRISIHANGDAAIDMTLTAIEAALKDTPRSDARHRIEHCSLPDETSIQRMAAAGVTPSFLMNHVYYFGRYFRDEILGLERANILDPAATAAKHGVRFTFHSDYSVTNIQPLRSMQTAVTRKMRDGGEVLNPKECISAEQALRAVTIDAAWQCGYEREVGSIETGKRADFVILEKNPLKVAPDDIASIKVLETYVSGDRKFAA